MGLVFMRFEISCELRSLVYENLNSLWEDSKMFPGVFMKKDFIDVIYIVLEERRFDFSECELEHAEEVEKLYAVWRAGKS